MSRHQLQETQESRTLVRAKWRYCLSGIALFRACHLLLDPLTWHRHAFDLDLTIWNWFKCHLPLKGREHSGWRLRSLPISTFHTWHYNQSQVLVESTHGLVAQRFLVILVFFALNSSLSADSPPPVLKGENITTRGVWNIVLKISFE